MNVKRIVIILVLIFWPLSLFLHNTFPDWIRYIVPSMFMVASYLLFKKDSRYYFAPLIFIPFIEPKLAPLPLIFLFLDFVIASPSPACRQAGKQSLYLNRLLRLSRLRSGFLAMTISFIVLIIFWKPFWGQTIFKTDYEAQQLVIRNTQLYPTVLLARTFQNKPKIIFDKFTGNVFAITDPNNYFFSFHPREIVGNQNAVKFPFMAIVFFLIGIYCLARYKNHRFVLASLISCLLSLSLLSNFDRQDFILWLPVSLIIINGLNYLDAKNKKLTLAICCLFVIFTIPEFIRLFIK